MDVHRPTPYRRTHTSPTQQPTPQRPLLLPAKRPRLLPRVPAAHKAVPRAGTGQAPVFTGGDGGGAGAAGVRLMDRVGGGGDGRIGDRGRAAYGLSDDGWRRERRGRGRTMCMVLRSFEMCTHSKNEINASRSGTEQCLCRACFFRRLGHSLLNSSAPRVRHRLWRRRGYGTCASRQPIDRAFLAQTKAHSPTAKTTLRSNPRRRSRSAECQGGSRPFDDEREPLGWAGG